MGKRENEYQTRNQRLQISGKRVLTRFFRPETMEPIPAVREEEVQHKNRYQIRNQRLQISQKRVPTQFFGPESTEPIPKVGEEVVKKQKRNVHLYPKSYNFAEDCLLISPTVRK